jgi:iron complex outermembrane receptor protein
LFLRRIGVVIALPILTFAQQTATNQKSPTPLSEQETIVVTGTYTPGPLEESDRSLDLIDTSESPTLFRSWADALRLDPSIDLRQRSPGTQGDLSIRGSSFGQTLVLVDGIRVNDAQSGHHNLDLPIPFESIHRIEVLHGSGSTLYGSDAVGGAVNFITAPPVATEFRLGVAGGNFGTNTQNGSACYLAKNWSEQLAVTRDFSSGFRPDRDYRNFAIASQTGFQTRLGLSTVLLGLSDRPFGADQFYGNFNSWERTKGWFAAASQQLGASTQLVLGYRRHTDEFILLRDRPQVYENNHITESWQGAVREHTKLSQNTSLYYGAEIYRDVINSNNLGQHVRNRGAAYLDWDARVLRRFSLSLGAREEAFSKGTPDFSPTISGGYWISSHLRLRASVAHAFRIPSYTDLYYSDPANVGNPNLRPEKAWGYEGGIEWNAAERLSGNVTLFHRREHDVIDYVRPTPASVWQAVNIDNLQFTGVEMVTRLKFADSQQIDLGYTGLYGAQQALAGLQSKYVFEYPVNQVSAGWLGWLPARVQLRARAGITQRYHADAYPLMEISATRRFGFLKPYFQVTNLTNTGYEEIQGVRMPGRAYLLGMQATFARHPHATSN